MALNVTLSSKKQGHPIVKLEGRLDTETTPLCESKIKPLLVPSTQTLIFDLKKLEYISSMGLRLLLKARKTIEAHKGKVVFKNMQPPVAKVLEIANMIPTDIARSEKSANIYLDAIQNKEVVKNEDVSG